MNRLIQGDVGSGKTMVAAAAAWIACREGAQAAIMAPTELLAEQHYKTLSPLFESLGIRTLLLTGSMSASAKRAAHNEIFSGAADVIIGTHAIITDKVVFRNLSLVITDEQHRFGVRQRELLTEKGENVHLLVMSATPIPRTLALIVYGDLDLSIIDELPPGRKPVQTFAVDESYRPRLEKFIRKLVGEGRQVFIVCPLVEDENGVSDGRKAAESYAEHLRKNVFPDMNIACIHGKQKQKDKDAIMSQVVSGNINILVATTVIEVGIDVPNATLMIVENAELFGLSQLHQLRGRVGRGKHTSYCVLINGGGGETAKQRMKVMCDTTDGFKIAEADLELRGPGDLFGSRQHGIPELRIANIFTDTQTLQQASQAADWILEVDRELKLPEHALLKSECDKMLKGMLII